MRKKKKRRRDPFFDPFLNSFFTETDTKYIKSDEVKITVKAFPEPKPIDFNGAVGDFNINVEVDQIEVNVNEGITFTVNLQGTGNLGLFTLPSIDFPQSMEAFPPNTKSKKDIFRNQITGSQSQEYVIIPKTWQFCNSLLEMSFYNLKAKNGLGLKQKPIELKVIGEESIH